jgi:hypothetical protein
MTTENRLKELAATLHNSMREGVDLSDPSLIRRLACCRLKGTPSPPSASLPTLNRHVKALSLHYANGSASSGMRRVTSSPPVPAHQLIS